MGRDQEAEAEFTKVKSLAAEVPPEPLVDLADRPRP
jgi:hypothetical protein